MITVPGNNQFGLDDGSRLGSAVAMSEFVAVAGAPFYSQPNWPAEHGNVRVYRRSPSTPWALDAYLTSNNPGAGDQYGAAVSTDGGAIAIGAPRDDRTDAQGGALTDSGCVYIQRWGGSAWVIEAQLFAPDASAGAHFGSSVDISGERLVVGAAGAKKAYVFRRIVVGFNYQWVADETIEGPAGDAAPTSFANAVALTGETVAIGDELADTQSLTNPGAVYLRRPSAAQSDSCGGARVISAGTYSGCTLYASRDGTTNCGSPASQGPDVWFSWTPGCSGTVTIDTIGSQFDTVLSVHTGCPDEPGSTTVVCNDDASGTDSMVTFNYTGATTYLIRVAGYGGQAGAFMLNVDEPAPTNDTCAAARVVTSGQHTFTNYLANTDGPTATGCYQSVVYPFHNDVWFRYTAQCTGPVTVDTCGTTPLFDTVLAVYTGPCPTQAGVPLVCNDDAGNACPSHLFASTVTFQATAGQEYLLRVGGFDANGRGDGVLNISCATACPADWNGNGQVNSTDISAFLTSWLQSVSGGNLTADFNQDQAVNSTDISAFLTAWLQAVQQGC